MNRRHGWLGVAVFVVASGTSIAEVPPNPVVSRGKPVVASADAANAGALVDGVYGAGWRPPQAPCSAAIRIGPGFDRLLLSWNSPGNANYTGLEGVPVDYVLETSANSTDGIDGTWTGVATVAGNSVRTRAHRIEFTGSVWVRMSITAAPRGVELDEIDVHDVSGGSADTWFFMGDSITAVAFDRIPPHQPSFAEAVHAAHPPHFPAMINGGIFGDLSADGVRRIDAWLALNPDVTYWAIGYGTNDCSRRIDPNVFQTNLQLLVERIRSAGRIPLIARIPFSPVAGLEDIPNYNLKIDELATNLGLTPGPDLYGWFYGNRQQIASDGIHPTNSGIVSMNRLWAQAVDPLYAAPPPPPPPPPPPDPDPAPTPAPTPPPTQTSSGGGSESKKSCGLLGIEVLLPLLLVPLVRRGWPSPRARARR